MTALRTAALATAAGILALVAAPAAAQEALPFEYELPLSAIEADVNDCLLEVTVQPGAEPMVQAHHLAGSAGEQASFNVGQGGGRIRIERAPTSEGSVPARAVIRLVIDPSQPLHVVGREINLVVHGSDSVADPAQAATPKLPTPGAQQAAVVAHSYELTDSEADLTRIPPATIVADNTSVHCEGGTGELALELTYSDLTAVDRTGSVRLASVDSEVTLERFAGTVEFDMQRGGLRLMEGTGAVQGKSTGGYVAANGRDGAITLTGDDASFELRDGSTGQLKINSSNTISIIDNIRGHVNLEVVGGQVSMDSVQGTLTATVAEGGQLTNDSHYGAISLNLKGDAYGEVNESQGTLEVHVSWAELMVADAKRLDLTSESSRVTLEGIQQLAGFDVRDSEVELDLTQAAARQLTVHVGDGSAVEVLLPSPCQVQVRKSAVGGSGINVTGCELQMERAGRMRRGRRSVEDGRRPFWLIARVAETGTLRVHGGS